MPIDIKIQLRKNRAYYVLTPIDSYSYMLINEHGDRTQILESVLFEMMNDYFNKNFKK